MLRWLIAAIAAAFPLFLSACNGDVHGVPSLTSQAVQNASMHPSGGGFTEYPVPNGVAPRYVALTPGGAVWFGNDVDFGSATSREIFGRLHAGKVTMVQLPAATQNVFMGFATAYGKGVWGVAVDNSIDQGQDYLVRARAKAIHVQPDAEDNQYWALGTGPDGRLWYAHCLESCGNFGGVLSSRNSDGSFGPSFTFANDYYAVAITGAAGNLYVSVHNGGPPGPHDSYVYEISTAGTILQQIVLPDGSSPEGLTAGPDGNVWVTEPGTNQIARISTGGSVTQFALSTPNAQPQQITTGGDGALWFTEMGANAIGRITTSGTITQYAVPTANSQPFGIASAGRCPGAHAVIWFSEFAARKIGKLRV